MIVFLLCFWYICKYIVSRISLSYIILSSGQELGCFLCLYPHSFTYNGTLNLYHIRFYNYLSMNNRKRFSTYYEVLSIASCSVQWYDDKLLPTKFQPHKWNNRRCAIEAHNLIQSFIFHNRYIFMKAAKPLISFTKIRK